MFLVFGVLDMLLFTDLDGMAKWLKFRKFECMKPIENPKKNAPTGWHIPSDAEWDTLQNHMADKDYDQSGGGWWSATVYGSDGMDVLYAWYCFILYHYHDLYRNAQSKSFGFSVRLVKD